MADAPGVNQLHQLDKELDTILTSFDTSYAWNYGSVKEGLRDLYEKAKREQWNATSQLKWDTDVDPEGEIIPEIVKSQRLSWMVTSRSSFRLGLIGHSHSSFPWR